MVWPQILAPKTFVTLTGFILPYLWKNSATIHFNFFFSAQEHLQIIAAEDYETAV